jgi:(E)-4-hydroxy-3-methylbut-2-enyl-diphosphate synthase
MVGNVPLGSDHPIRVQTMTTSDTKDVARTVEEVMRIADKGADIVRITVQGRKEADACFDIKNTLVQKNYNIPLVADIHFAPTVALRVAECFDKIRVNPGNFADRRAQFEQLEYTDDDYQKELEHIEKVFSPLVEKCKQYGRAMRIGTNHGSLSDRIMSYYGDSPRGMVESALEFARICRKLDFHNFVFSMKASNPVVMVQAYRLLVAEMYNLGWDYPLHLGVTEAGEGEDGRMKSAIGIGTLLMVIASLLTSVV